MLHGRVFIPTRLSGYEGRARAKTLTTPWNGVGRIRFFFSPAKSKKKEYSERRLLGYSMEQMFRVVAEIEHYKNFVPWCTQSDVVARRPGHITARMQVGFPPLSESYTSSITLTPPNLVRSECTDGWLFNYLIALWKFSPGMKTNPQTCTLDFSVAFEFRSALHSHFAQVFFNEVVRQNVNAFLKEARRRYGKECIKSQKPQVTTYVS
ncbi:unnamed protein product, partial [Darwinula stevensoni]